MESKGWKDCKATAVQIGPPRPLPGGETPNMLRQRLKTLLADQFPSETPFTIQRLAELLLEPHKHYSRLDKLVGSKLHCVKLLQQLRY